MDENEDIAAHLIDIKVYIADSSPFSTTYKSSISDPNEIAAFAAHLRESAASHSVTGQFYQSQCYRKGTLYGIMIDTGAARGSSSSNEQYMAYCRYVGRRPDIDGSKSGTGLYAISLANSQGIGGVDVSFRGTVLTFSVYLLEADTPMLLCLDRMDKLGILYNNPSNKLVHL